MSAVVVNAQKHESNEAVLVKALVTNCFSAGWIRALEMKPSIIFKK